MKKVNLVEKLKLFEEHWSPKIIGQLNGQEVKIAKVKGEFIWHDHADEDEMFLIIKGTLKLEFRDHTVTLEEGEMLIIPKGVEHKPIAMEEVYLLLFEPASTKHTGNVEHKLTKIYHDHI
ncbi:MAG: cupin domain-containing protein [Saprospiraceae bacterium]